MASSNALKQHAENVLKLLGRSKNVILVGAPATGKSKILYLVGQMFLGNSAAALHPGKEVPIPSEKNVVEDWMPSPGITSNRKSYKINFHQGTKHRDFVSGIIPNLQANGSGFKITNGLLMGANLNAIDGDGASLVIIDEINRGPAVSIFGDTIASIEQDKRLDENNQTVATSAPYYSYTDTGEMQENFLSPHLYILASMNEADTSVEPLDVAFLRRFSIYRLSPEIDVCIGAFGLEKVGELPKVPTKPEHVMMNLVNAWSAVNSRILIGKGQAYQIGHGFLIGDSPPGTVEDALQMSVSIWGKIETHVKEVFYGNEGAQAFVFNASSQGTYKVVELEFGDMIVTRMDYGKLDESTIYNLLSQVAANDKP